MALVKVNAYFFEGHWKGFAVKTKSQHIKKFILNLKEDSHSRNSPLVFKCCQR